jgi:predicted RNase H-like nuclease
MTPQPNLATSNTAWIAGIDLAWGDKRPDGLCLIQADRHSAEIVETTLTHGDDELLQWLKTRIPPERPVLLAIDAPLIAPNSSGCRPVDRQISVDFGRYHAACHSANAKRCVRPLRIASLLRSAGFTIDFDLKKGSQIATEVYPHPAMIRLFEIEKIVKYKKGLIAARRLEFARLQGLLRASLKRNFPKVVIPSSVEALLATQWSKGNEDQTDALFCALIGYHHWETGGTVCDVKGSLEHGFILLPPEKRSGLMLFRWPSGQTMVTSEFVKQLRDADPYG